MSSRDIIGDADVGTPSFPCTIDVDFLCHWLINWIVAFIKREIELSQTDRASAAHTK